MDSNFEAYNSAKTQKWYSKLQGLSPAEKKIFEDKEALLKKSSLLDIGIGGGRTTKELIDKCKEYIGIDYSPLFVEQCKRKFPHATIQLMDARDLSFTDNKFDVVNFSLNGIDYVNAEDRSKIMKEVNRVLKPGGLFFFSTHNRSHPTFNKSPWLNKEMSFMYNLKTFLRSAPFLFKKFLNKKNELTTKEYSMVIDNAHNYSLLTFYTEPSYLKEQLQHSGFGQIQLYDRSGIECPDQKLNDKIYATAIKAIS